MKDTFATTEPIVVDCRPGFSFFFDLIRNECGGLECAPLHRVFTLMRKMGVQCFTREDLAPNQEILDEQDAAAIRTGGDVALKAVRLSFFRDLPKQGSWQELAGKELLGYAVLVSMALPDGSARCFILESV